MISRLFPVSLFTLATLACTGVFAQSPTAFGVENIDAMMEKVKASGGSIVTPKNAIPTVGWFCYAKDPEGVPFGMMQSDENAK